MSSPSRGDDAAAGVRRHARVRPDRRRGGPPMLADLAIADRVVAAPPDGPLGSLGAVLARREPTRRAAWSCREDHRRERRRSRRRHPVRRGDRRRADDRRCRRVRRDVGRRGHRRRRRMDRPRVHRRADQRGPRHRRHDAARPHRRARLAADAVRRHGVPAHRHHVRRRRAGGCTRGVGGTPGSWTGAVPLGLHLEGPMLAAVRRGAHPRAHLAARRPSWSRTGRPPPGWCWSRWPPSCPARST